MPNGCIHFLACSDFDSEFADDYEIVVDKYDAYDFANAGESHTSRIWLGVPVALGSLNVSLRARDYQYDADDESWYYDDLYLEQDKDFTLEGWYTENGARLRGAPIAYYARFVRINSYHGQCDLAFSISDPYGLDSGVWYIEHQNVYADTAITEQSLKLKVEFWDDDADAARSLRRLRGRTSSW